MKMKSTNNSSTLILQLGLILLFPFSSFSQNLLNNSAFENDSKYWDVNEMKTEINAESGFGGKSDDNKLAEIDNESGLRQTATLKSGYEYLITFTGSRNINKNTPDEAGIIIYVIGVSTGNAYLKYPVSYKNTEFELVGHKVLFTIPTDAKDEDFYIEFVGYNNSTKYGVVVDDIELALFGTLPVKLISFSGEIRNNQTILNWKTANEINNKHFIIERSANGNTFESIGTVTTGLVINNNYSFTDSKPGTGTQFYRLRQVDQDGRATFSKIVTVKYLKDISGIKIFPTVATTEVNFNLSAAAATTIEVNIYDVTGKKMMQANKTISTGANQQSVEVAPLQAGLYYLQIKNSNGTINFTQPFQKAN